MLLGWWIWRCSLYLLLSRTLYSFIEPARWGERPHDNVEGARGKYMCADVLFLYPMIWKMIELAHTAGDAIFEKVITACRKAARPSKGLIPEQTYFEMTPLYTAMQWNVKTGRGLGSTWSVWNEVRLQHWLRWRRDFARRYGLCKRYVMSDDMVVLMALEDVSRRLRG